MATSDRTFYPFPRLPAEIRIIIWLQCLPRRTLEISYGENSVEPMIVQMCPGTFKPTEENCQPPLLLSVCRESRQVAKDLGHEVKFGDWATWLQPRLDCFLLLHTDRYKSPFYYFGPAWELPSHPDPKIAPFFVWSEQSGLAPCVSHMFIEPFSPLYGCEDGYNSEPSPWPLSRVYLDEVALIIQMAQNAPLSVSIQTATMHMTRQEASLSGLFSVFAEDPIRLVDAYDSQQISHDHNLWQKLDVYDDEDVDELFARTIADDWTKRLDQWMDKVAWTMAAVLWLKARSDGFSGIESPSHVWMPQVPVDSAPNYQTHCLNNRHPWAEQLRHTLPVLQPKVEFRVCWATMCLHSRGKCLSRPRSPEHGSATEEESYRPGGLFWISQDYKKRLREYREKHVLETTDKGDQSGRSEHA